jgi:hypothetical protein
MPRSRLSWLFPVLVLGAGLVDGCASSQSVQDDAAAQAAAVGTWAYEVQGAAPLDEGRFHITVEDGTLKGLVRDRRLGRLRARVQLRDSRLELALEDLRISGYIEDDQFTGSLRRARWNVTTRRQTRSQSRFRSTSLFAQRVQSATAADKPRVLDCRSLLRETSGCD